MDRIMLPHLIQDMHSVRGPSRQLSKKISTILKSMDYMHRQLIILLSQIDLLDAAYAASAVSMAYSPRAAIGRQAATPRVRPILPILQAESARRFQTVCPLKRSKKSRITNVANA
jgi:hypothetical protein